MSREIVIIPCFLVADKEVNDEESSNSSSISFSGSWKGSKWQPQRGLRQYTPPEEIVPVNKELYTGKLHL